MFVFYLFLSLPSFPILLMFTDSFVELYLPPPDLGACQPYMYKIVLFCENPLVRCPFGTRSIY